MQLEGSTVLLTGASGGIGQAIAHALDARGARLILSGRRLDALEALRSGIGGPVAIPAEMRAAALQRVMSFDAAGTRTA